MKNNDSLKNVSCQEFIDFLNKEGYEIKMVNPRHVGGQGYSPPPYFSNVNTEFAVKNFIKLLDKKKND